MATGRVIRKNLSVSKKFGRLKHLASTTFYPVVYAHADREGRFTAEPDLIKAQVFPRLKIMTKRNIEIALEELTEVGLILLYEADNDWCLEFVDFKKYSKPDKREAPSKIPPIGKSSKLHELTRNYMELHGITPYDVDVDIDVDVDLNSDVETNNSNLHIEEADSSDLEIKEFKDKFTLQFGEEFEPTKDDLCTWFESNNGLRKGICLYFNRSWIEIMYFAMTEMKLATKNYRIKNPIAYFNAGVTARGSPPHILNDMKEHKQNYFKREG